MAGRYLGEAFFTVSADTRLFRSQADIGIHKALAGINPNVRLGVDTKSASAAVAAFQARVTALGELLSTMRADIKNDKGAESKIAGLQARVITLAQSMAGMTASADTRKLDAQIAAETAKLRGLQQQMSNLQADADTTKAAARIAALEAESFHLNESLGKLTARVDIAKAETKIKAIDAELRVLGSNAKAVKLSADNTSVLRQIAVVKSSIAKLKAEAGGIRLGADIDPAKLVAAEAALLGFEAAAEKIPKAAVAGDVALGALGKALTGTGRGWGFLTRGVTLFGGAFNRILPVVLASVAVWHVLADAIIELAAVWIPATLAVGAFAVAASDAAKEIASRMQAVHTVMDATGQAVAPMTNAMEKLHAAVRPQVYQLFGDVLTVVNSRTGVFAQVAKATGTVLDQLAARMVFAVTAGNKLGTSTTQLSGFWKTAITDVSKLGDSIGNLFGIFGNLFKALPGFAAGLLTIGDDFTKILESASAAAVPVLKWILLLHGYILYTGLAVTATLAFIGGIANLAKQFVTFAKDSVLAGVGAIKSFGLVLARIATALLVYATNIAIAGTASGAFAAALAPLAANPMLWVAAAALALGALVFEIVRSKNAAQQFNDTMQQTIASAGLSSVVSVIQSAQAATTAKLAAATGQLNQQIKTNTAVNAGRAGTLNSNGAAIQNLGNATNDYRKGLSQLSGQQRLVSGRFADLTKQYGGSTAALGLLNAAGITGAQITDTQGHAWAQALIQIRSTVQAYTAMGTQAGQLGNDLDVLGRTVTDQYASVQKLNQAWGAFISDVTGTQGTFDTVAEGFRTLADHSGKLSFSLGKLKASYSDSSAALKSQGALASATAAVASAQDRLSRLQSSGKASASQLAAAHARLTAAQDRLAASQLDLLNVQKQGKSAIDALTPAGLALNQAFTDQIGNLDKLFASWRTAGLSNNLFVSGVKDGIAPLLRYAAGSQEATAQLVALAQEAGYQGPISFSALTKWLGNTHGATQKLKEITNQATTQEALLTGAMQAQGNFIVSQLIGDISKAILKYDGVEKAVSAYGRAVAQSGKDSADAKGKMTAAISAIVKAELSMGDNANQMAAIVAKTFGIEMPAAIRLVKGVLGDLAAKSVPGAQKAFITFAEVGLGKTKAAAHDLWNEIAARLGPKLDALGSLAGGPAKNKFIDWAENGLHLSKNKAEELWQELVTLQNHINGLHGKNVGVNFVGTGSGNIAFKESIPGVTLGPSSQGLLGFHAAGGFISGGTPGKDSVLGMLMPGEVVVPTDMVRAGAVDHLRGQLPGFAAGGAIPGSTGSARFTGLDGPAGVLSSGQARMAQVEKQFGEAVEKHFFEQVVAKLKKDMNSLGGSGSAIVNYARSFLGKIPYVFGGTSLSGDDCSGFTQAVYGKFGIHAPRTSEAQFQWATRSAPVPGSLAFYVSSAGGPPPGHVAIVQDGGSVISQGGPQGVKGPKIESLHFLPLMGTGVPKGGLPQNTGGGGNAAIGGPGPGGRFSEPQLEQLWIQARGRAGAAGSMGAIAIAESGGDPRAHNPSGASGLWQILGNPFPGNPFDPLTNARMAVAKYNANGFFPWISDPVAAGLIRQGITRAKGGLIPRMAAGGIAGKPPGRLPGSPASSDPMAGIVKQIQANAKAEANSAAALARFRQQLGAAEGGEHLKFFGLEHSFGIGPAKYRTKTVMSELGTLAKRQQAELAAYARIGGKGLTKANLSRLGSAARAEQRTAGDQALSHMPGGHPLFARDLRRYLGTVSALSGQAVPTGTGGPVAQLTGTGALFAQFLKDRSGTFAVSSGPAQEYLYKAGQSAGTLVPQTFDRGGYLRPGWNLAYNGTGRPEAVGSAGRGEVHVHLHVHGPVGSQPELETWLLKSVRSLVRTRGGGSAQAALGRHEPKGW